LGIQNAPKTGHVPEQIHLIHSIFLEEMRHSPPNYRNTAHPENLKSQAFWTEDPIPIQGTSTHIFDIAIANYLSLQ